MCISTSIKCLYIHPRNSSLHKRLFQMPPALSTSKSWVWFCFFFVQIKAVIPYFGVIFFPWAIFPSIKHTYNSFLFICPQISVMHIKDGYYIYKSCIMPSYYVYALKPTVKSRELKWLTTCWNNLSDKARKLPLSSAEWTKQDFIARRCLIKAHIAPINLL